MPTYVIKTQAKLNSKINMNLAFVRDFCRGLSSWRFVAGLGVTLVLILCLRMADYCDKSKLMFGWLFAGGSVQKPVNSCYAMTAANEMSNQMRTGETIDNNSSGVSMDTDRLVSSFTVNAVFQ